MTFPDDDLGAAWAAARGQTLVDGRAWGLPLVRDGAYLRGAGGGDLPGVLPDLGAPLLDEVAGSGAAAVVLADLVDEDGAIVAAAARVPGARLYRRYDCWAARFGDDPEAFIGHRLSTKRRKRLRYDQRQLAKRGPVRVEWVAPGEAMAALDRFIALAARRAAATGRYDATLRDVAHLRALWRRLAGDRLLVNVLRVGETPVSFRTGFAAGERFLGYMPMVDRDLDGVSAGDLHMALLLPALVERGLRSYHMGKGGLGNKAVWASDPYSMWTLLAPLDGSARARAAAGAQGLRERARRAVTANGWEPGLRRVIHRGLVRVDAGYRRAVESGRRPEEPR